MGDQEDEEKGNIIAEARVLRVGVVLGEQCVSPHVLFAAVTLLTTFRPGIQPGESR